MIISCDICLNDHYSDNILQNNETDNDFMSSLKIYSLLSN